MNDFRSDLNLFGTYLTKTFKEIFAESTVFINEYSGTEDITDDSLKIIFRLLYGRFANSSITNMDENQFKAKLYGILYMYGPSWQKRVEIQKRLRELTESEILAGAQSIYNHATNPGTEFTEADLLQLKNINDQTSSTYLSGKVRGYENYMMLIKTDVTKTFIDRFESLFIAVVKPQNELLYMTEEDTPWNF